MTTPHPPLIDLAEIIEAVPAVVMRLSHRRDDWRTWFITGNISQYGYDREDFMGGRVKWFDLVHPDDKVVLSKRISDYEARNIDSFRLHYRLLARNGDSVPVTEFNTVRRNDDGGIYCYDTVIVNSPQSEPGRMLLNVHARQQLVMNDILMSLHDSDLDNALRIILDRAGVYLDCSRVLLFKDNPDHTTCKAVYEWRNSGISSVLDLDYVLAYNTAMPEIYVALQNTGVLLVNAGEIPENCREVFESEELRASAIFAVYLHGEHYGFVCFDDCVIERKWDDDTARFLKNISNLISTVLARQKTIKELDLSRKVTQTVLDNVNSYIFTIEPETDRIIFANQAFKDIFGEDCEGRDCGEFLRIRPETETDGPDSFGDFMPDAYCEETNQWLGLDTEEVEWVDGRPVILVTCSDVTVNKLYAEAVEHQTFIDYLTKLPNRYRCDMILPEVMAEAAKSGMEGCLLMIDLDDFRRINNHWGHDYGDDLLLNIAAYLKETFPETNKVFRFGGDEFVILINHLESKWVDDFISELLRRSARPWKAIDREFQCTFSIGAVKFSGRDSDHRTVLRRADLAMYDAKNQGKNRARFYEEGLESAEPDASQEPNF